ncbi:RdgB/HAM1 family non-canonical purine NTP pyrophosphatase [Thalassospira lucentensis]|uniref:RdgB/HAM1 family non-canonical purine NTP pyrophosphatase n=1 Tax=Thalassospira lucentensis TaxID=168935 RepID=UPI0003B6332A|nr:RdgB/HAM1 family non-canonical purine NTP pyrophosphatase [Thalassospira lucentensis]RCK29078.1 nucleoside-triphosphate diphosphatase [Thalassospira lucentensis MCCC 1A00383 = DSM 14000]
MARRFTEKKLVIASHNKGKIKEIGDLLAPFGIEVFSAGDLDLPEPEETEKTFIGNAQLKSTAAATAANLPALADDSGLAVSALDGAPGIYSARWAGPDKDFDMAMEKVQNGIGSHPDRRASFICALSLAWPDGHVENFEGRLEGDIVWPKRGRHGFGYDPIFQPKGCDQTFGEIEPAIKHEMSHRADAFAQLVAACFK